MLLVDVYMHGITLQLWRSGWKGVLFVNNAVIVATSTVAELNMLDVNRHAWDGLVLH